MIVVAVGTGSALRDRLKSNPVLAHGQRVHRKRLLVAVGRELKPVGEHFLHHGLHRGLVLIGVLRQGLRKLRGHVEMFRFQPIGPSIW